VYEVIHSNISGAGIKIPSKISSGVNIFDVKTVDYLLTGKSNEPEQIKV